MPHITKITSIKAEPNKIIEYIADVHNHPAFISALRSVDNISGNSRENGTNWDWAFTMAGVEIQGKAEMNDYKVGKHYSFKTTGGIVSSFGYTVEPEEGGSRLTIDVSYELPDNVLAKMADKSVIEHLNEQEAERAGENLKVILEA